jgi:hypothetical protein
MDDDRPRTAADFSQERVDRHLTPEERLEQWGPGPWVEVYRDLDYVKAETERLAAQVAEAR